MASDFSVALSKMTEDLDLQKVYIAENFEEIKVSTFEVNRPGLELTGYFDFFDSSRLLLFGTTEFRYLSRFGSEAQKWVIDSILSFWSACDYHFKKYRTTYSYDGKCKNT